MGLVAEFDIACEALPLVGVAAARPTATLGLELQYNHGNRPQFLVTVTSDPNGSVESAFDSAHDVDRWTLVSRAGDTRHYQLRPALSFEEQLGDHLDDLDGLEQLAAADAIIERIEVTPDGWRQTGWFADRAAFDQFRAFWQQEDRFTLRRLTEDGDPEPAGEGLTDRQREALRTAYEMGYFDIPREASLAAVAAELSLSPSALSERLRRAQTELIEETVARTWSPLPAGDST